MPKKEYFKPEIEIHQVFLENLMEAFFSTKVNVEGDPGNNQGGGGAGNGNHGEDDPDNPMIPDDAKKNSFDEVLDEFEEDTDLIWGLSWKKLLW